MEYKIAWENECRELESMTCLGDTETFSELNSRASSNVAKMTPQVPDNDSATQQGASGGFENLMLMMPGETTPVGRGMRLKWIKQLLMQKDPEGDDKEDEKEDGVPDLQEDEKEQEVPDL